MLVSVLLASLLSSGFSVTFVGGDAGLNVSKYFNETEQKFYPCYYVKTKEFGTVNACQSGDKTVEIMQVKS